METVRKNKYAKAYLAWATICIVWGTTYLAIRIGVAGMPPMLFAGSRWIIAGPLFYLILRLKGVAPPPKSELKSIAIIGISLLGIANGLVVVGEQWIPSGLTALLITTLPFWIIGLESMLPRGPKLNFKIVSGIIIGFIGVAIIFSGDIIEIFDSNNLMGAAAMLSAVIFWSLGTIYSKRNKIETYPLMSAAVQMIIAGIFQLLLSFIMGERFYFGGDYQSLLSILYLIVFGSIIGFGSYTYAIHHLPISFVSTYAYINPLIALFLGWLVLDEKLNIQVIIAAVIIFIGVTLVKKGSSQAAKN